MLKNAQTLLRLAAKPICYYRTQEIAQRSLA